jgi:NAD(P)-dependent dehydrogenase (short-subunit alcohol dehydrogenase family)
MVKLFSEAGHNVLALSRNSKPISDLKLKNVTALEFDIADESEIVKLSTYLQTGIKSVDVLINNAGFLVNKPFAEITSEEFKRCYDVNVFGVASLIKTTLPFMKKEGHVVSISSMGGVQGSVKFPGLSAYSSSKGAIITLTELLAEEYKETGPSFNVLALGSVQTEMLEEAFPGFKAPLSATEMAQYIMDFSLTGNKFYNGKILQVSSTTP